MVNTFGLIIANIKDNGLIIKCMGKVNLLGLMARNTKVLPPLIRNKQGGYVEDKKEGYGVF
jgi:hypothetical protein